MNGTLEYEVYGRNVKSVIKMAKEQYPSVYGEAGANLPETSTIEISVESEDKSMTGAVLNRQLVGRVTVYFDKMF